MKRTIALVALMAASVLHASAAGAKLETTPVATPAVTTALVAAVVPAAPLAKVGVLCKHALEITGYIKLDAVWDKTGTDAGNYARYVNVPSRANDLHRFSMSARETRLGLAFPTDATNKVGGKLEFDFYNAGGDENKNVPMLRHAYVEYDWAGKDMNLLAGQTSDVISPLVEPTVNYVVGWWAGNIGYRRPQIRFSIGTGRKASGRTLIQMAVSRTIGANTGNSGSGEMSGLPTLQGRLAQSFKLGGNKPSVIGVWGHWGEENYFSDAITFTTSCIGGDLELNLGAKIVLKGEGFWGRDLAAFLGGIGQGVTNTPAVRKEVRGRGAWAAFSFGPFGRTKVNLGGGFDKPCHTDLVVPTDRVWNRTAFVNTMVQTSVCSRWGTEVSAWRTNYLSGLVGESTRLQLAFYLDF